MFPVQGEVCLVTGAARGFGKEFAVRFLKAGAKGVCISDVNDQEGKETLKELQETFGNDKVIFVR